ncbi:ABC transporter, ATPase subunit [Caballeronia sordidicola]|uniref:ABC transporter, ATPase subunit n=1 Tax=Caballeronia sordidicola TaxID=196367 RepID=A0A158HB61_CABSO|nr:ABC transporter ATP-binding protein [Caballeronia sordidicola]SAL41387.1 ABC transporter, ATPase subunit [Caballeronia sordidicola]
MLTLSQDTLLEVRHCGKRYDTRTVLDSVSLTIRQGEIVSLVDPSGCGKSTLLRIVAGLDRNYDGDILLEGVRQQGPSSRVGVVFQEPRLLPWLDVADNVAFPAGSRQGSDPRVGELLAQVGLANARSSLPKHLSGGMAQRVAIARGLFTNPDLLLLDEPFSAVDAITRMRLQDLLLSLVSGRKTATLLVTHDLDEALYLSDRVLLMTPTGNRGAGHIAREIAVPGGRPRERNGSWLATARGELLDSLGVSSL